MTFDNLAVEVGDNEVGGGEGCVVDSAGFDDDEGLRTGAVDSAGIAEGVGGEAAAGDLEVCMEDLFAE